MNHTFRLTFLFLFFHFWVFSQKVDSVAVYYNFVNQAQAKIMTADFDSAVIYYKRASNYLEPFGVDGFDACLSAIKCRQYQNATFFASFLMKKGIKESFFTKGSQTKILTMQPEWKKLMATNPQPTYNENLRQKIIELCEIDQKYRADHLKYADTIYKIDTYTNKEIWKLFKENGYLSEKLIGVFPIMDTLLSGTWTPFDELMIHQVKREPTEFVTFFEESVRKGQMKNSVFISQATNFDEDKRWFFRCMKAGNTDAIGALDNVYVCCCEEEILINENRKRIFFPDLTTTIKQSIFKKRTNGYFSFGLRPAFYPDVTTPLAIEKLEQDLRKQKFILYEAK